MEQLQNKSMAELLRCSKERRTVGVRTVRKKDLIWEVTERTLEDLRAYCRQNKIKRYSRLRKADFLSLIDTSIYRQLPFVGDDDFQTDQSPVSVVSRQIASKTGFVLGAYTAIWVIKGTSVPGRVWQDSKGLNQRNP
jgi:hypothetical protein